ncbi:glycoside hydrolase family 97 protein [Parasphingorhabdus cellanae]|nr:glycoside hydrolase family 97 protein [Parasphingorhabdus cellanae]
MAKAPVRHMLLLIVAFLSTPALAEDIASIASPNGQITVSVMINGEGRVQYAVAKDGAAIIAPSQMGFQFTDAIPMARGLVFDSAETNTVDTQWDLPWGERTTVVDRHNELAVKVHDMGGDKATTKRPMTIRFRVFDDGVGFRYEFPARADGKAWNIADENTEFVIAQEGTSWWTPAGDWNRYEYLYHETSIDSVSSAHTPITMKLADGTHLSFHEAALVDYSGMWLKRIEGRRFRSTLAPSSRDARVTRTGAFNTPWRTIRIADDAAKLYDSDLELNLNEPNKLGDVSWVEPFKYIGIWWEMHLDTASWASGEKHGATTANTKRYIDFAAKHGFRGVLVEGWNKGWDGDWFGNGRDYSFTETYPDFDIEWLADYARKKGVRLIGHHETGGNIKVYEAQLDDAMALYERLGIDAVKTGYVADAGGIIAPGDSADEERFEWHDGQTMVRHHLKVVETAAKHKVAVNPHEPIKDTGLRRTYPNWVSREGARGMEYQAWGEPGNGPDHVPTMIFTRMLSGPMDYTPGVFSLKGRGGRDLESTLARQLALYVVVYSPIQMAADLPENLAKYPKELAFLEQVPVDWSETRTLAGEVGDYAVIARKDKASADWYIGGVTDEEARDISVDMSFLPEGADYVATIWRDGDKADYRTAARHDIEMENRNVTTKDKLPLRIAPGGGFAIRLTPAR